MNNSVFEFVSRTRTFLIHRVLRFVSHSSGNSLSDVAGEDGFDNLSRVFMSHLLPDAGHRVVILQPARNYRKLWMKCGTEDQSFAEARALVHTLKKWTIVDEKRINIRQMHSKTFFSEDIFQDLGEQLRSMSDVTAVFVNWRILTALQVVNMERCWNKFVFDRYMIVLQIFKLHSKSAESQLQVQLAQLPFFKSRLFGYHHGTQSEVVSSHIGNALSGHALKTTSLEEKSWLLKMKEHKLQAKLKQLEEKREIHKEYRRNTGIPLISVLGYTNSGKTSLIRSVTHDTKVVPEDNFFATLDVTYHDFHLKLNPDDNRYGMSVIMIDTIGFLSEIPTQLISAFRSTLMDTLVTNLLLHIVDVSNPFWEVQMEFTLQTLRTFKLPDKLLSSCISVGTKIDLLTPSEIEKIKVKQPDMILISNKTGENKDALMNILAEALQQNLQLKSRKLKVKIGSNIYQWLLSNCHIQYEVVSEKDPNSLLLNCLFSQDNWARFKSMFAKTP